MQIAVQVQLLLYYLTTRGILYILLHGTRAKHWCREIFYCWQENLSIFCISVGMISETLMKKSFLEISKSSYEDAAFCFEFFYHYLQHFDFVSWTWLCLRWHTLMRTTFIGTDMICICVQHIICNDLVIYKIAHET